jgi:hypothetical protein
VIARLVALVVALVPGPAWACATCVASAYGDRTFNWAFLGLILMPFVVGVGIATVLAVRYYAAHRQADARTSGGALAATQHAPHEVVGAGERHGAGAPPFEASL